MSARDSLTGLVLSGGQGRRMQEASPGGEVEKGLLMLNGLPLVDHARRVLAPHAATILISANTHADAYAQYGIVVPDEPSLGAYSGPLAGVASALACSVTSWLVVMPVDVLGLPEDLVPRLLEAVNENGARTDGPRMDGPRIAYARTRDAVHPLCMVLHRTLRQSLHDFLSSGERKVQLWQRRNEAAAVQFEDADNAFFNINTPQDLLRAQAAGLTGSR